MYKKLKQAIQQKKVVLFVGSGVSATLGMPTWTGLLSALGKKLGYDSDVFQLYGSSLSLAEFYMLKASDASELKSWMHKNWQVPKEKIITSEIFKTILLLDFPLIYTTNYDHCIETAYQTAGRPCEVISNVRDLAKANQAITHIIKYHGDYDSLEPIVLTESSYYDRLSFESPLDIKLRADILGKSILFLGYSVSDINIRLLLYKLNQIWQSDNQEERPLSYIFMATPNPIQQEILKSWGIESFIGESPDRTESMEIFLKKLL